MQLPPYDVFPTIHADRIILREIVLSDLDHILEISFYDGKPAADTAEALEMLQRIEQDYLNGETVHWGIADKNSNVIMGTCGYYRGFQGAAGELGCILRPAFRGQGIMKEAIQAASDFGQQQMGLQHIFAITTKENQKALALLERLGFVQATGDRIQDFGQRALPKPDEEEVLYLLGR